MSANTFLIHKPAQSHHGDNQQQSRLRRLGCFAAIMLSLFLLALPGAAAAAWRANQSPTEGAEVDVAPWGERTSWEASADTGVYWEDARDVKKVAVTFADTPPEPDSVRLQWWQSQWPERRVPRDRPSGAGESGWTHIGDLYQGRWRDGDAECQHSGKTWTYVFRPINAKEFTKLSDFAADYRTTMKLRLLFKGLAPKVQSLQVFTDSAWKSADLAIEWGGTATAQQVWDGQLEVFNGYVERVEPLKAGGRTVVQPDGSWRSQVKGQTAGISARVWYTQSPNVNSFDKTVATVRARQHSFSFSPAEVAAGSRVFAPIYGVLARRAADPEDYAAALTQWKARAAKPVYERVFDEPEQTFARAWSEMPAKRQFYIPLGCEGGRQRFGVDPDGSAFCVNDRIGQPPGKDTPKRKWGAHRLRYTFGLPQGLPDRRSIEESCLPIIHARWEREGLRYTQTAFATRLEPGTLGYPDMQADDTTVLMVRIQVQNIGNTDAPASAAIGLQADGRTVELSLRDGLVYGKLDAGEVLRCATEVRAEADAKVEGGKVVFSGDLPANEEADLVVKIPFVTLEEPGEIERLKNLNYYAEYDRVRAFWRQRAEASAQIRTPVNEISNFYRAHVSHLLINCGREVGADRLMARVGSFGYGVYGNESCMMITDLDRRGFHREAERCLETFLQYQGSVQLPGDYSSQEGVFNGANGWEAGGYNQHHGWIMWAMAEHYWYSGDAAWLRRNADKLIKACRWISGQRARTQNLEGLRRIERGLLPPGSLEDIGDWRGWMSNNGFSWWGLDAVARALGAINHPEAKALQAEADAYKADILRAFKQAMVRSPLVRLRDGSHIPQIPSEVHRRGRTFGWITVTLEGAIYLVRIGLLEPNDPLTQCIMQDYEDNLYLSEQYGYSPKHLEYWFSRGGFSMQPNLLCSPHPYLLRDEIKHFLRSYFNAFAVCYYPNTQMMTEHPLPDLGDWRGDHYKSSDESNSTYWLRLMFIHEQDPDLHLGMAVPRYWLADGGTPAIERAATHFGPMSLRFESQAAQGRITAILDPPTRRAPRQTCLRFRHPQEKPIVRVTVNGQAWTKFDAKRELVELPPLPERATIIAYYAQ
jgi:hypothetical protein